MKVCRNCRVYTLKPRCPSCGEETSNPAPARYSPQDRFGQYRRRMKQATKDQK